MNKLRKQAKSEAQIIINNMLDHHDYALDFDDFAELDLEQIKSKYNKCKYCADLYEAEEILCSYKEVVPINNNKLLILK